MSRFLRLLVEVDKGLALADVCTHLRCGMSDPRSFEVSPESFDAVPGKPFSYWVSDGVRKMFSDLNPFDFGGRFATVTNQVSDDARYIRIWWEPVFDDANKSYRWVNYSKSAANSPYFCDIYLLILWSDSRQTYHGFLGTDHRPLEKPASLEHFFRPGLTWPRRTNGLSFRAMPAGCIFANKGPAAFVANDSHEELLALSCLVNSRAFGLLVSVQLARVELAQSFEVGLIQQTPVPALTPAQREFLSQLARRAWSLKRSLDTVNETSHAFILPADLRPRIGDFDPPAIEAELARTHAKIDDAAFDLYGFSAADRLFAKQVPAVDAAGNASADADADDEDEALAEVPAAATNDVLSWAVGVAFGRFDWRLATGERPAPPEPEPFDRLPAKSPGMRPDISDLFHVHAGILVDDPGHPHDLVHVVEDVLARVQLPIQDKLRHWLQQDFFSFHLQRYSKSRRKAPIYWPLPTVSGDYALWLYYPSVNSQTLYTAVNDFVEPKLDQVANDVAALRKKGAARTRDEEKRFDDLEALELDLIELRDQLLKIAPTYRPSHDDGVQIAAAPLWPLFRHRPWQKVLKETWAKLEKGDYDWAHLAMNYWPDRVREKCKTDKSLAIAHGLEVLYIEPPPQAAAKRGRKAKEA